MDETKLRHIETHYKLRVRTGCETCKIRKVKCDETKPACLRCTKTGRTCDGYSKVVKGKKASYVAAASLRNSAFLVVPQKPVQNSILRSPTRKFSDNPMESRSFEYFRNHTLPMWTEFFDSELWSRTIVQLSHVEPAIKHGILALSTMHERYESSSPIFTADINDFAFIQHMQAVKHSNELLRAHQKGNVSLEMVLIACIIFICYENLAGNYQAASMHLRNGMRILEQNKLNMSGHSIVSRRIIANVMYRFDLQAMTFSDNASRYDYALDMPPTCPQISETYKSNLAARDDLVGIVRCMMWVSGVGDQHPQAPEHPTWLRMYKEMVAALVRWEIAFDEYRQKMPPHEQRNRKIYAGNILLRVSAITMRIMIGAGSGARSELAWDPFVDSFKTIVDLAETIPVLRPQGQGSSAAPPAPSTPNPPQSQPAKSRPLLPNPATTEPTPSPGSSTFVFSSMPSPSHVQNLPNPFPRATYGEQQVPTLTPSFFSPSFELSAIVPLFIVACRCRDPVIRRRALHLLLSNRRREGVWDSLGAGMIAAQFMKKEENLTAYEYLDFEDDDFLARDPDVNQCSDIPDSARVKNIYVAVNVVEGKIDLVYSMTTGEEHAEQQVIYESRAGKLSKAYEAFCGDIVRT